MCFGTASKNHRNPVTASRSVRLTGNEWRLEAAGPAGASHREWRHTKRFFHLTRKKLCAAFFVASCFFARKMPFPFQFAVVHMHALPLHHSPRHKNYTFSPKISRYFSLFCWVCMNLFHLVALSGRAIDEFTISDNFFRL